MQRELLGTINVDFDAAGQLLVCMLCIRQTLLKKCAVSKTETLYLDN
jgi:hypothetical protein